MPGFVEELDCIAIVLLPTEPFVAPVLWPVNVTWPNTTRKCDTSITKYQGHMNPDIRRVCKIHILDGRTAEPSCIQLNDSRHMCSIKEHTFHSSTSNAGSL